MLFPLTLIYISISLLSAGVFPVEISNLHLQDIFGGMAILACLLEFHTSGLLQKPETYLMMGLIVVAILSIVFTGWIGGGVYFLIEFMPLVLPFFFVAISCRSTKRLKILTAVMTGVAFFIIFHGVTAQMAHESTNSYIMCEHCDSSNPEYKEILRSRGLGILNDPNDLAQFLVALLPLLWLRWKQGSYLFNFLFTIVPACVLLCGLYFTHSRGGTIGLGLVLLFAFRDKLGVIAAAIITGVAGMGVLAIGVTGGRGISDDDGERVNLWYEAVQAFKSHPIFGLGAGRFGDYSSTHQTAHNSYILCLAELGLVGYFFWMGTVVAGWSGLTLRLKKFALAHGGKIPTVPVSQNFALAGGGRVAALPEVIPVQQPMALAGAAQVTGWAWPQKTSPAPSTTFEPGNTVEDEATLAYFARIFRISLVGLLATAFFLTRVYSPVVYVFLGMAAVLNGLGSREGLHIPWKKLIKKIWIVMLLSILVLYGVIRGRSA